MECIKPKQMSFDSHGRTTFEPTKFVNEIVPWFVPCGQCLACRLNNSREKAIRAVHQLKTSGDGIFLTLTYDPRGPVQPPKHFTNSKDMKRDFQLFAMKLRTYTGQRDIKIVYTGEFGSKNKRFHWHALLFGYRPDDPKLERTTDSGSTLYTSEFLTKTWGNGIVDFGSITLDSASYVCRYALKELDHGWDSTHQYKSVHQMPKPGLGREWILEYLDQTFTLGYITLRNGDAFIKTKIPRYYLGVCKVVNPPLFRHYMTQVRPTLQETASERSLKEELEWVAQLELQRIHGGDPSKVLDKTDVRFTILKQKLLTLKNQLE